MPVFEQYREIVTPSAAFKDLDMDFNVVMEKSGKLKFEATIWNLREDTWRSIKEDDIVQVKGGWIDGPVEVLTYGKVNSKNQEADGNDLRCRIRGKDQTSSAMNARISKTWTDQDPANIAASIAREIGLSPQVVTVGQPINGNWTVTRDKPVKRWLDDLVEIAGEKTGSEWEWTGETGELVFQPKKGTYRQAPVLSYDTNLVNIAEKEDAADKNKETKVQFTAMMVPGIKKGSAVDVKGAGDLTDVWKVESYKHRTSSVDGEHITEGLLIPTKTEYPVEARRTVNVSQRKLQQLGG